MFTLFNYLVFGIILICFAGSYLLFVLNIPESLSTKKSKIIFITVELIIFVLIITACGLYNTHTESGKRSVKTWYSESTGGLNRTVVVYDMEGDEVARYTGKFDIEESSENGIVKIKFDDQNGKRHIIYAQTGTVLIDEN